jgi:hypothetical protein
MFLIILFLGKLNCWVLANFHYERRLDIYEEKRFINQFSNSNYHFISYISNDFNYKKIVLNLAFRLSTLLNFFLGKYSTRKIKYSLFYFMMISSSVYILAYVIFVVK